MCVARCPNFSRKVSRNLSEILYTKLLRVNVPENQNQENLKKIDFLLSTLKAIGVVLTGMALSTLKAIGETP